MNSNRIDLADIYGLDRSSDMQIHSKSLNIQPPALEQIAGIYNMPTVPVTNNMSEIQRNTPAMNDMDNIMVNSETGEGFRPEKCLEGRCRFSTIPHRHTETSDNMQNTENTENLDNSNMEDCLSCRRNDFAPIVEYNQPYPITAQNIQYLNTFIRSQVGRRVHVDFLIGTNNIVEKDGYLMAVGANFILLNPMDTKDILACDFHNIKFMRFYY